MTYNISQLGMFGGGARKRNYISKVFSFFCTLVLNKEVRYVICDSYFVFTLENMREYFRGVSDLIRLFLVCDINKSKYPTGSLTSS